MIALYKRNAQGKPLVWRGKEEDNSIIVEYGLVGGTLHKEVINITKKNVNELQSRIKNKRKEGYKELTELKDNVNSDWAYMEENMVFDYHGNPKELIFYLNTYLPKYSTTEEGFVLPMLAKVLKDNKPFEKFGTMLGQWKINGLRCIIGAEQNVIDMFNPISLTYHSRTGENWTPKMRWMDEILLMMIEEGDCLDGELYLPGYTVNEIDSFVKNTTLKQHYQLQYWCYDICCENMSAGARNFYRISEISTNWINITCKETHLNNKEQLVLLPTVYDISNINEALSLRDKFISYGFEGLILRNPNAEYQFGKRNQSMFKFKKVDDGKFIIADIKTEHKRTDLPLFVLFNDINDELFECSINKPQDVQREILANKDKYIGKYALVEFRERSGVNQLPFHARIIDIIL